MCQVTEIKMSYVFGIFLTAFLILAVFAVLIKFLKETGVLVGVIGLILLAAVLVLNTAK